MRHHVKNRTLGRDKRQRVALLRSLARSIILHEGITTTITKAKEVRPFVERLVTTSKQNSVASRRDVMTLLNSATATKKLHDTIAPRYAKRAGGYTRIIRIGRVGTRVLDAARIEFVK
jgi:large subunit ribosomal protein L17